MNDAPRPQKKRSRTDNLVETSGIRAWLARRHWVLRMFFISLAIGLPTLLLAASGVAAWYTWKASRFPLAAVTSTHQSLSEVFDCLNRPVFTMGQQVATPLTRNRIPAVFVQSLLAREDRRFLEHAGIDIWGIGRATLRNLRDVKITQGASTITMQVARLSFNIRDKTWNRKLLEMALAVRIEKNFTKDEILTAYCNLALFSPGLTGLEAASLGYFGKSPETLTLAEAALLAANLRNPAGLNPRRHPEAARSARDTVLDNLREENIIDDQTYTAAKNSPITLTNPIITTHKPQTISYIRDMVTEELDDIFPRDEIPLTGLRIWLTLDAALQNSTEQHLETHLSQIEKLPNYPRKSKALASILDPNATPYLQGACVLLDHTTGGILAIVGGRDIRDSRYNRATASQRQAGSVFKPFVYALAYEKGLEPTSLVSDAALDPREIPDTPGWNPKNVDGKNLGEIPVEMALVWSRNTASIRVGKTAHLSRVADLAIRLGMRVEKPVTSQIMIGNVGVSSLDLAAAYGMFLSGGRRNAPHLIARIEDSTGTIIYRAPVRRDTLLRQNDAALVHRALTRVLGPEGTARDATKKWDINFPAFGKTGTTNDGTDAWFAGCADRISCVVWVGMDKPEPIIADGLGSTLALPLWASLIKSARNITPEITEISPDGPCVCRISGAPPNPTCRQAGLIINAPPSSTILPTCPHDHTGAVAKGDLWRELKYFIGAE